MLIANRIVFLGAVDMRSSISTFFRAGIVIRRAGDLGAYDPEGLGPLSAISVA